MLNTHKTIPIWMVFLLLVLFVLAYSLLVYIIPTLSAQPYDEAFDAFNYARWFVEDPNLIRESQPFLEAYPVGIFSEATIHLYSIFLHFSLMLLPLMVVRKHLGMNGIYAVAFSLAIPESAIFLGATTKEGMAIAAVIASIAGQALFFADRKFLCFLMMAYAIGIAEYSRPGFGYLFSLAIFMGFFPCMSQKTRRNFLLLGCIGLFIFLWVILDGPLKKQFSDAYYEAQTFLIWFEENLTSNSIFKTYVRHIFSLVFTDKEPTLFLCVSIIIMAFLKSLTYLFAIPIVSLPSLPGLPAEDWAVTWQISTSIVSLLVAFNLYKLKKLKVELSIEDRCRFIFAFLLLFLISISTVIFHVRYRVPAMIAILIAIWLAKKERPRYIFCLSLIPLIASVFVIFTYG